MVLSISGLATTTPISTATPSASGGSGFDAALAAAQQSAARQSAISTEMQAIRKEGFVAYARDLQVEKLREEIRQQVLSASGLTEDQLSHLPAAMQSVIEKRIEQAIQLALGQAVGSQTPPNQSASGNSGGGVKSSDQPTAAPPVIPPTAADPFDLTAQGAATGQVLPGEKKPGGTICPVIPVLVWPGGPSLLG